MVLLKLAIIFLLILVFLGLKKPLSLVMVGAAILAAVLFAIPAGTALLAYGKSLISANTLSILATIWLVMLIEGLMNQRGYTQRMMDSMDALFHSHKVDMITMPMIIGFLPSVGGALFSAPMVEEAARGTGFSPERKTCINMHYRHVMETFFPAYPSTLIALQISGVSMLKLTLWLLPMAVIVFCLGLWFLRGMEKQKKPAVADPKSLGNRLLALVISLWPFLLIILLISAFDLAVWLSCLIAYGAMLAVIRPPMKELPQTFRHDTKPGLLLMTVTVLAFKDVLIAGGAVDQLAVAISGLPIPPMLIYCLMATFVSLITGLTFSANGIVMPLAQAAFPGLNLFSVALLHISSYIGAQLTPTHMCLSITAQYFKANLQRVILYMLPVYLLAYLANLLLYGVVLGGLLL